MRKGFALAAILLAGCAGGATVPSIRSDLAAIETRSGGRLGVALVDSAGRMIVGHRADERFAMCSTFKLPLAAMVLDREAADQIDLDSPIPVSDADMIVHAPYVEAQRAKVPADPVTVRGAAGAAVSLSDNVAANLLLDRLGGPAGFTAWLRSGGDSVTRLDRREPELNENAPGDPRDTTTPAAMVQTTWRLVSGSGLDRAHQQRLFGWMKDTSTGLRRIRAGLPSGWDAGDKTGTCRNAFNDVAVFTAGNGERYALAIYLDRPAVAGDQASAIIADATRALLPALR